MAGGQASGYLVVAYGGQAYAGDAAALRAVRGTSELTGTYLGFQVCG